MENNNNLNPQLWKIANDLRGNMDSSEFKNYILGLIFLRFLSETVERKADKILKEEGNTKTYSQITPSESIYQDLLDELKYHLGYYIEPEDLFVNLTNKAKQAIPIIEQLSQIIKRKIPNSTQGEDSEADFEGLFDDLDLSNSKLGNSGEEKNELISKMIINISDIEGLTTNIDILGDAYEYLIKMFASDAGKKGGEFYTPTEVSEIVASLVAVNNNNVKTIYDPTCGSGSLLIKAAKKIGHYNYIKGQELNVTTYNLARMNMFLHGVNFREFDIKQGDTLKSDQFVNEKFDAIVANPPFGVSWDANPLLLEEDERFGKYGKLAPKSKGEFAFLQHMLHHLSETGTLVSVVPHGVLFRGGGEKIIRQYMIQEENAIDAIIGLPANLFFGTGIPAAIIVMKKCRETKDVLFIDASKDFNKVKTQNVLDEAHIKKIIDAYTNRDYIEKYAKSVNLKEIQENDYNLNIPRYVDTFEAEEEIDISKVKMDMAQIKSEIEEKEKEIGKQIENLYKYENDSKKI
jgi:type I restriction enzyme M protein